MKKGVSLSLNTVIIGVLLLIVLAVVIFIFFRGTNTFDDGARACEDCRYSKDECPPERDGKKVVPVPMQCTTAGNDAGSWCCTTLG